MDDGDSEALVALGASLHQIFVKTVTDKTITLEVESSNKIDNVKVKTKTRKACDAPLPTMSAIEKEDAFQLKSKGPITRSRAKSIAQATQSLVVRVSQSHGSLNVTRWVSISTLEPRYRSQPIGTDPISLGTDPLAFGNEPP